MGNSETDAPHQITSFSQYQCNLSLIRSISLRRQSKLQQNRVVFPHSLSDKQVLCVQRRQERRSSSLDCMTDGGGGGGGDGLLSGQKARGRRMEVGRRCSAEP